MNGSDQRTGLWDCSDSLTSFEGPQQNLSLGRGGLLSVDSFSGRPIWSQRAMSPRDDTGTAVWAMERNPSLLSRSELLRRFFRLRVTMFPEDNHDCPILFFLPRFKDFFVCSMIVVSIMRYDLKRWDEELLAHANNFRSLPPFQDSTRWGTSHFWFVRLWLSIPRSPRKSNSYSCSSMNK